MSISQEEERMMEVRQMLTDHRDAGILDRLKRGEIVDNTELIDVLSQVTELLDF